MGTRQELAEALADAVSHLNEMEYYHLAKRLESTDHRIAYRLIRALSAALGIKP